MRYNRLTLNIEHDADLNAKFSTLIRLLPQLPLLDQLIADATQDGPITVDFVGREQSVTGGHFSQRWTMNHRGQVTNLIRDIKVVRERSFADMLSTLVFELCNAKNPDFKINSPTYIDPHDFVSREDFAYATEGAEYNHTHLPARQILCDTFMDRNVVQLFRNNGIRFTQNEIYNLVTDHFASFDDWWVHVNRINRDCPIKHSDSYRSQYDRAMGRRAAQPARPIVRDAQPTQARPAPSSAPALTPVRGKKPTPVKKPTPAKRAAPAPRRPARKPAPAAPVRKPAPVKKAKPVPTRAAQPVSAPQIPVPSQPNTFLPLLTISLRPAEPTTQFDQNVVSPEILARLQAEVRRQLRQH